MCLPVRPVAPLACRRRARHVPRWAGVNRKPVKPARHSGLWPSTPFSGWLWGGVGPGLIGELAVQLGRPPCRTSRRREVSIRGCVRDRRVRRASTSAATTLLTVRAVGLPPPSAPQEGGRTGPVDRRAAPLCAAFIWQEQDDAVAQGESAVTLGVHEGRQPVRGRRCGRLRRRRQASPPGRPRVRRARRCADVGGNA